MKLEPLPGRSAAGRVTVRPWQSLRLVTGASSDSDGRGRILSLVTFTPGSAWPSDSDSSLEDKLKLLVCILMIPSRGRVTVSTPLTLYIGDVVSASAPSGELSAVRLVLSQVQ